MATTTSGVAREYPYRSTAYQLRTHPTIRQPLHFIAVSFIPSKTIIESKLLILYACQQHCWLRPVLPHRQLRYGAVLYTCLKEGYIE